MQITSKNLHRINHITESKLESTKSQNENRHIRIKLKSTRNQSGNWIKRSKYQNQELIKNQNENRLIKLMNQNRKIKIEKSKSRIDKESKWK